MHRASRNSKLDAIGRTAWIALLINLYFKPHWKWLTCYVKYFAVLFHGSLEYATINTKKISILKRPLISFQVTQSEKCCKIWTMDSCKGEICKNPGKRPWKKMCSVVRHMLQALVRALWNIWACLYVHHSREMTSQTPVSGLYICILPTPLTWGPVGTLVLLTVTFWLFHVAIRQ